MHPSVLGWSVYLGGKAEKIALLCATGTSLEHTFSYYFITPTLEGLSLWQALLSDAECTKMNKMSSYSEEY